MLQCIYCYNCQLPTGLANIAKVLHLGDDAQKDARGKALIRYFSMPCKPTKANGGRTRNMPTDAPDKWAEYIEYNRQDVVVEKAIRKKLLALKPPETEHQFWCLDQRINNNGIAIDQTLVNNAISMNKEYSDKRMAEAAAITGLSNPNSVIQLKEWMEKNSLANRWNAWTRKRCNSFWKIQACRQTSGACWKSGGSSERPASRSMKRWPDPWQQTAGAGACSSFMGQLAPGAGPVGSSSCRTCRGTACRIWTWPAIW